MILRLAATFWLVQNVSSFTNKNHGHSSTTPRINNSFMSSFAPTFGTALYAKSKSKQNGEQNDGGNVEVMDVALNGNGSEELNGIGADDKSLEITATEGADSDVEEEVDEMQLYDESNMRMAIQQAQST